MEKLAGSVRFQDGIYRYTWLMRASGRIALVLMLGLMFEGQLRGQNLVPNPSFEDYVDCPDNPAQIERALEWRQVQGTPEYFNICSSDAWASVPTNRLGHQFPHTGVGYAGLIIYSDSDWFDPPELLREVMGIALTEPLVVGFPVTVSFWVAPAAFGMVGTRVKWTTSGIGAKFSMQPVQLQVPQPAMNDAVVHMSSSPLDTAGWTLISGTYVPDSAYNCLLIGNFISDSLLSIDNIDPFGTYGVAYTYVDEVCVSSVSGFCSIEQGVQERGSELEWAIGPNPVVGSTRVHFDEPLVEQMKLELFDISGRAVASWSVPKGTSETEIHFDRISSGQYLLECRSIRGATRLLRATLVKQ